MAAEFVYPQYGNFSIPNNDQNINVYDTIYVQYRSSWPNVNVTLFCLQWNTTSGKPYFYDLPANPVPSSGLYSFGSIQAIGYWTVFPTSCTVRLTKTGFDDTHLDGEIFWMTSNPSTSTTFSPKAAAATVLSISSSSSRPASSSATTTSAASSIAIPSALASVSAAAATASLSSDASSNAGLSTGAKAGIAVGAIAVVAILLGFIFFFTRHRRAAGGASAASGRHELSSADAYHEAPAGPYAINEKQMPMSKHEIDGAGVHELNGHGGYGTHGAHELPS